MSPEFSVSLFKQFCTFYSISGGRVVLVRRCKSDWLVWRGAGSSSECEVEALFYVGYFAGLVEQGECVVCVVDRANGCGPCFGKRG